MMTSRPGDCADSAWTGVVVDTTRTATPAATAARPTFGMVASPRRPGSSSTPRGTAPVSTGQHAIRTASRADRVVPTPTDEGCGDVVEVPWHAVGEPLSAVLSRWSAAPGRRRGRAPDPPALLPAPGLRAD